MFEDNFYPQHALCALLLSESVIDGQVGKVSLIGVLVAGPGVVAEQVSRPPVPILQCLPNGQWTKQNHHP
jgi:hypothetical protein